MSISRFLTAAACMIIIRTASTTWIEAATNKISERAAASRDILGTAASKVAEGAAAGMAMVDTAASKIVAGAAASRDIVSEAASRIAARIVACENPLGCAAITKEAVEVTKKAVEGADAATEGVSRIAALTGGAVGGATVAVVAAPLVLSGLGFGARGVVAGSVAAEVQRTIGNVAARSAFAAMQRAGAAGLALSTKLRVGLAGAAVGATVGTFVSTDEE